MPRGRPPIPRPSYPNRIRAARTARKLTLKQLSAACGMGIQSLAKVELGRYEVTVRQLERIAAELRLPAWALLNADDDSLATDEWRIIDAFRNLAPEDRQRVITMVCALAGEPPEPSP